MTDDVKRRRAPAGMGERALNLWHSIADEYELRPDEYRILEDACRETALVDLLERELKGSDMIMKGSMGQPVVNPLVSEIRQHRNVVKTLLSSLHLPDGASGEDTTVESRSSQARDAAKSRWTVAHGKAS